MKKESKTTVAKKSVRITNDMRCAFVRRAISGKFKKDFDKIESSIVGICRKLMLDQWSKSQTLMDSLPTGFFRSSTLVSLKLGGMDYGNFTVALYIRPESFNMHLSIASHKKLESLFAKKSKLEEDVRNLKAQLRSTMNSFTTSKKLYEQWPEAREVIDFETECSNKVQPRQLPAIEVKSLNESLGLPKK